MLLTKLRRNTDNY